MEKHSSQATTNRVPEMRVFTEVVDAELHVCEEIMAESVGGRFIKQRSFDLSSSAG